MIWCSFIFNTCLTGERSDQSCGEDGITKGCWKWLSKVLWRNSLHLQIFHLETSIHFAVDLRKAYDILKDLLTDQIYSITLSKSPVNTYGNHFHLCAKANITDLVIHFCRQSRLWTLQPQRLHSFCLKCFAQVQKAEMKLWSLTFFQPFKNEVLLKSLALLICPLLLEQKSLLPTMLPFSALLTRSSLSFL